MHRLVALLAALCCLTSATPALAWFPHGLFVPVYQGPGDIVSGAKEWYSCVRAYNGAGHVCDVLAATGGGPGVTGNCGTGGDNGQSASAFCNATTCFVVTAYDQSGANQCSAAPCNATQATTAIQPQLIFTGCHTITSAGPCVLFTAASSMILTSGTITTLTQPYSVAAVADGTTSANVLTVSYAGYVLFYNETGVSGAVTLWDPSAAGPAVTTTNNVAHALNGVLNGASSVLNVDGTDTAAASGAGSASGALSLGGIGGVGDYLDGEFEEFGLWSGSFSSGQRTLVCDNARLYYGTGGSC
jgi:hypothetical protein